MSGVIKPLQLTHYSNGVKRQWDAYYLTEENIEVNFSSKGIVKDLRLKKRYSSVKAPKDEALIVEDDPSMNDGFTRTSIAFNRESFYRSGSLFLSVK